MSERILKYPLRLTDRQEIELPQGAEILTAQMQGGQLMLWAMVDQSRLMGICAIRIIGTGHDIADAGDLHYIATVQDGAMVWHVFEEIKF